MRPRGAAVSLLLGMTTATGLSDAVTQQATWLKVRRPLYNRVLSEPSKETREMFARSEIAVCGVE
jgi:hypothetical protein